MIGSAQCRGNGGVRTGSRLGCSRADLVAAARREVPTLRGWCSKAHRSAGLAAQYTQHQVIAGRSYSHAGGIAGGVISSKATEGRSLTYPDEGDHAHYGVVL